MVSAGLLRVPLRTRTALAANPDDCYLAAVNEPYRAATPFQHEHPSALAVYCSDGRFTRAVEELLSALGHDRLDTLTVPGGPALLDLMSSQMNASDVMRQSAGFLIRGHGIRTALLLSHDNCGYYRSRYPLESPDAMHRRQLSDLRNAGRWLSSQHSGLNLLLFHADITDDGGISFEPVEP
jgi:hypothetical protein